MTQLIRAYYVDNNKQNGMTSPKKPIDAFCKRNVELHVSKQNGVPNYLDIQRKDMTFVKKNIESLGMWLRGQYVPRICREISARLYMTLRQSYRHENFKYGDGSYVVSEQLLFTSTSLL